MKPDCIHCSRCLCLVPDDGPYYSWRCEAGCAEGIDTGVLASTSITPFLRYAVRDGDLEISRVIRPLLPEYVPGACVYMPQILYHFIECTWGGCYNHLYLNCISPYLESSAVVDYVLRTPVVRPSTDTTRGSTGALIYGELRHRLRSVRCPEIAGYIRRTFDEHAQPSTIPRTA